MRSKAYHCLLVKVVSVACTHGANMSSIIGKGCQRCMCMPFLEHECESQARWIFWFCHSPVDNISSYFGIRQLIYMHCMHAKIALWSFPNLCMTSIGWDIEWSMKWWNVLFLNNLTFIISCQQEQLKNLYIDIEIFLEWSVCHDLFWLVREWFLGLRKK